MTAITACYRCGLYTCGNGMCRNYPACRRREIARIFRCPVRGCRACLVRAETAWVCPRNLEHTKLIADAIIRGRLNDDRIYESELARSQKEFPL